MFLPWDGEILGWSINFLSKQVWRVLPYMDMDDLLQEAYLCYVECKSRYGESAKTPENFFYLYKLTVTCMVNTAASRRRSIDVSRIVTRVAEGVEVVEERDKVEAAPEPIKKLLAAFAGRSPLHKRYHGGCVRETTRELMSRISGIPAPEVFDAVLAWATGDPECCL